MPYPVTGASREWKGRLALFNMVSGELGPQENSVRGDLGPLENSVQVKSVLSGHAGWGRGWGVHLQIIYLKKKICPMPLYYLASCWSRYSRRFVHRDGVYKLPKTVTRLNRGGLRFHGKFAEIASTLLPCFLRDTARCLPVSLHAHTTGGPSSPMDRVLQRTKFSQGRGENNQGPVGPRP